MCYHGSVSCFSFSCTSEGLIQSSELGQCKIRICTVFRVWTPALHIPRVWVPDLLLTTYWLSWIAQYASLKPATCAATPQRDGMLRYRVCWYHVHCSGSQVLLLVRSRERENMQGNKVKTTTVVNLASTVERMDEQILPALYNYVGQSFQASPSQLGTLTLCRALLQAISSPVSGLCGHYCDRVRVTSAGCFIWGVCTAGFSTCRSLRQGYLFWAVNGIGLSFVIPTG